MQTMTDRERLIELIKQATTAHLDYLESIDQKGLTDTDGRAKFIADHLLANGVIVPKYNVGDTVWYITGIHRTIVKSAIVEEIIINCNGVSDLFVTSDTGSFENSVDIFYTSKEEAENALKERVDNG